MHVAFLEATATHDEAAVYADSDGNFASRTLAQQATAQALLVETSASKAGKHKTSWLKKMLTGKQDDDEQQLKLRTFEKGVSSNLSSQADAIAAAVRSRTQQFYCFLFAHQELLDDGLCRLAAAAIARRAVLAVKTRYVWVFLELDLNSFAVYKAIRRGCHADSICREG